MLFTDAMELPEALRLKLDKQGIRRITLRFDGYGDSGQVEDVTVEPEGVESAPGLMDELENVLLESLPGGWEINEGSFGTFNINVAEGSVESYAYWRTEKDSDVERTRWHWR